MAYPPITPLPTAPQRGDTPSVFTDRANAHVAALTPWTTEVNAAGAYMDSKVLEAEASADAAAISETNAATSEDAAVGAANYKGPWSSLSGPLAIPASVSHTGVVWLLKSSLADVTASQPSLVNTDWIALTQPVQTGSLALTSEFTLEGDSANVGDLMGLYSNGKVKVIKNHPGELAQNAVTSTFVNAILLSTTLGISVYRDESDGNKVKAQLYSIAGRKLTNIDTPVTIANTSATYIHADKIDANNIIIVYQDTSDSSQGKAVAVNIAANVLTIGAPAVFNAAVTTYCKVAVLTTAKAVIVYRDEGNSNYGVANTVAIAGLVLTPATEVNFKTAAVLYLDVCRLSDTSAVVSLLGTSSYPEAVALTINPGIVAGTPFVLKSAATANTTISRLTDTTFVAAYESGSLLYARLGTNSSGTITAGTELPIQANPSFLESCQLTATRVLVTGRNATVSNYGYYWVIDNTTGTTIVNSSSAAFNSGTTSYTFPSKILDNRVLIGYQDSTNYATSYVLDLSTETLQKIAGIAKEAGVEGNVIDVVTSGECDFLSGLVAGSYYYSSATGALSASIGDYEVGVAKSATNLLMLAEVIKVNAELVNYIDTLYASKSTPSYVKASQFNIWTTREIKTTSGTFTVPAGVYYVGIACVGKGGNGAPSHNGTTQRNWAAGGGGGGLSFSLRKVVPGQQIQYSISAGISSCAPMIANPGVNATWDVPSGGLGGTAQGGDYNYTGGSGGTVNSSAYAFGGGGGAGGGAGGNATVSGGYFAFSGGGGGRAFPDNTAWTPGSAGSSYSGTGGNSYCYGGAGSPRFSGGDASGYDGSNHYGIPASLGFAGVSHVTNLTFEYTLPGLHPSSVEKMGLAVLADLNLPSAWPNPTYSPPSSFYQPFGMSNIDSNNNNAGFGGAAAASRWAGFGAGQTGASSQAGSGVLGGGSSSQSGTNTVGYGGGAGGFWGQTTQQGGAAVVIFIY